MFWFLAGYLLLGPRPESVQAQERLKEGQKLMSSERFEEAATAFREAIRLEPLLVMAHYGLGQSQMALKRYPDAVNAFRGAREAFHAWEAQNVSRRMENASARQDRILALRDRVREDQERQLPPGSPAARQRDARVQKWEFEISSLQRVQNEPQNVPELPPGLSLALGSAHFRSGQLADAEREFRAALAVQPRLGEPRNNLAVVLLLTGRPAEAKEQLALAEKNGFKVSAGLKKDVDEAIGKGPASQ